MIGKFFRSQVSMQNLFITVMFFYLIPMAMSIKLDSKEERVKKVLEEKKKKQSWALQVHSDKDQNSLITKLEQRKKRKDTKREQRKKDDIKREKLIEQYGEENYANYW